MSSKSSGPRDGGAGYRNQFFNQILTEGNKRAGKSGAGFDLSNKDKYMEAVDLFRDNQNADPNRWGSYGTVTNKTSDIEELFKNIDLATTDLNSASMSNTEFDMISDANLASGAAKKTQSDFMEQMQAIFEDRKKAILARSQRPGQAATRGGML